MLELITDDEFERVKLNLNVCKVVTDSLGFDWIGRNLLQKIERDKVHALFWLFLDRDRCKKLDAWLEILKNNLPQTKFRGLINKIKNRSKEIEFYSLLSEIEVISYYVNKGYDLVYEPKQGDLKLILDNMEIFFEIARLFPSNEERRIDNLSKLVWSKLNSLDNNMYVIFFEITPAFSETDVESFINFASNVLAQEFEKFPVKFDYNSGKASIVVSSKSEDGKGYVAGNFVGVIEIHTSSRLKNKILEEALQLPQNKPNIIVYNLTHYFASFSDIEDAFYGQLAVKIYRETMKVEPFRINNGVIHQKEGERISAVIAYKDFDYENRRKYSNPIAKYPLSQEIIAKI
ncbi:MAG: hypothetical protein QXV01_12315 [Candidatus Bathyarchaeia archaeon]